MRYRSEADRRRIFPFSLPHPQRQTVDPSSYSFLYSFMGMIRLTKPGSSSALIRQGVSLELIKAFIV